MKMVNVDNPYWVQKMTKMVVLQVLKPVFLINSCFMQLEMVMENFLPCIYNNLECYWGFSLVRQTLPLGLSIICCFL